MMPSNCSLVRIAVCRPKAPGRAGLEVIEALAAEDQPEIALRLFAGLVSSGVSVSVCNYFIDSYFVVGNAVIRSQVRPLWEDFLVVLQGKRLPSEVAKKRIMCCSTTQQTWNDKARWHARGPGG
jgi:hypothetical protein